MSKKAKERLQLKKKKDKQKKIFFGVVGGIIAILVIVLIVILNFKDSGGVVDPGTAPEQATVHESGQFVYVPIYDVNDGDLHFYKYNVRGKDVRYFIVRGSDTKYHAALDVCQKLHTEKSGWRQDGDYIVCKDEGCAYPINAIGTEQPGCCWPFTLPFEIIDNEFQIKIKDLEDASGYF